MYITMFSDEDTFSKYQIGERRKFACIIKKIAAFQTANI